jgi:hypothetical protein
MNFEEMIKKWVKYDYCTPGIKSEVIIDMLISEFIEEIVRFGAVKRMPEKENKKDVELITKEFPFACDQKENRKDDRNFKADYLVADYNEKIMYVIELKTSKDSLSDEQFQNYTQKLNPEKFTNYWEFQEELIRKYEYSDGKLRAATEVCGSRKYVFTNRELEKTRYKKENLDGQKYTMRLQYIFLDRDWDSGWKNVNKSNKWMKDPIILRDLCENPKFEKMLVGEKKDLWMSVKKILEVLWESPEQKD